MLSVIFFLQVLEAGCRKFFIEMFYLISVRYRFCASKKNTVQFYAMYYQKITQVFCSSRRSKSLV